MAQNENKKNPVEAQQCDIREFRLPTYMEIPDVGLYLEQVSKFINSCLEQAAGIRLTTSMISNYVKQKLLSHPEKKQYSREQIATLMMIALCKTVLSLDEIHLLLESEAYKGKTEDLYAQFETGLANALAQVSSALDEKERFVLKTESNDLLWTLLITIAFRLILRQMLDVSAEAGILEDSV